MALKNRLMQIKCGKGDKKSCENLRILSLYEAKYSQREIAKRVGRDKRTVKNRLIQMGVIKE